jgi:hypothetical protein
MLIQSLAVVGIVFVVMIMTSIVRHKEITNNAIKMGVNLASMWVISFIFLSIITLIFYWSFYYAFIYPFVN